MKEIQPVRFAVLCNIGEPIFLPFEGRATSRPTDTDDYQPAAFKSCPCPESDETRNALFSLIAHSYIHQSKKVGV